MFVRPARQVTSRRQLEGNPRLDQLLFQFQNLNRFLVQTVLRGVILKRVHVALAERLLKDVHQMLQNGDARLRGGDLFPDLVDIDQGGGDVGACGKDAIEVLVAQLLPGRSLQSDEPLRTVKDGKVDRDGGTQRVDVRGVAQTVESDI